MIANNDAHVGFFSDKQHESEVYEIVIGGWGNGRSAIRYSYTYTPLPVKML